MAYRRWGDAGSPIVLLGGFAEPSWVWHEVGPLLGRTHRVVAMDLPPFGYTERVGDPTLTGWMGLVEAVTHRLGLGRPLVVGHSLGAAVATGIALNHPADVSGIVLLDGDALRGGGGGSVFGALLIDPYFTSVYRLLTGSDLVFRQVLERALGPDRPPITRGMLDQFQRPFHLQGTAQQLRNMLPRGIIGLNPSDLSHVHVPATVVWGQYDSVDSPSAGRRTAAALHAPFKVIPQAGHLDARAARPPWHRPSTGQPWAASRRRSRPDLVTARIPLPTVVQNTIASHDQGHVSATYPNALKDGFAANLAATSAIDRLGCRARARTRHGEGGRGARLVRLSTCEAAT